MAAARGTPSWPSSVAVSRSRHRLPSGPHEPRAHASSHCGDRAAGHAGSRTCLFDAGPYSSHQCATSRMSLDPDVPDQFEHVLDEQEALQNDPLAELPDGRAFPRRALFGRYVAETLRPALVSGAIRHRRTAVDAVERLSERYRLLLGNGQAFDADLLVIATTHPPPSAPTVFRQALLGDRRLIADPMRPDALDSVGKTDRVLIVELG